MLLLSFITVKEAELIYELFSDSEDWDFWESETVALVMLHNFHSELED